MSRDVIAILFPEDGKFTYHQIESLVLTRYSAVFQAGGLVVVLVEIFRKNFLASIVPVIVNAILNHHHLVVDIVAFVQKGDFPRSRLGEKQRGKILAGWVTRKIQTIAQFGIREPEEDHIGQIAEEASPIKQSLGSRNGTPSSLNLRRPDSTAISMTGAAMSQQTTLLSSSPQPQAYVPAPAAGQQPRQPGPDYYQPQPLLREDTYELPAPLSIPELPGGDQLEDDDTPTNSRHSNSTNPTNPQLSLVTSHHSPLHYSPIDPRNNPFTDSPLERTGRPSQEYQAYDGRRSESSDGNTTVNHDPTLTHLNERNRGHTPQPPVPSYAQKPYLHLDGVPETNIRSNNSSPLEGDRFSLPSQQRRRSSANLLSATSLGSDYGTDEGIVGGSAPAPLRITNRTSVVEGRGDDKSTTQKKLSEEEEWAKEALGFMGYAGTGGVSGHYGA
jgi:hypothetical protein